MGCGRFARELISLPQAVLMRQSASGIIFSLTIGTIPLLCTRSMSRAWLCSRLISTLILIVHNTLMAVLVSASMDHILRIYDLESGTLQTEMQTGTSIST